MYTNGGKATNIKKVTVSKSDITLEKKKTKKLKIKSVYAKKNKKLLNHTAKYIYSTTNKKVATVSKKGVVKAVGKGTCYIYVRAGSGAYAKVKITVK